MSLYSAALVLADNGDWWNGHMGGGWWIVMMVGMLLFWVLVIVLVVWLIRGGADILAPRSQERGEPRLDALQILERRLAEGDITVEEYRQRRAELTGPPSG